MTARVSPRIGWFWLSCASAFVADQLTKVLVYGRLLESREITVIPGFFYLQRARNHGVVWGLFGSWPKAVLIIGVIAAAVVVFYFHRYAGNSRLEASAWGLILGGALGNLIDRALFGYVKDFIKVDIHTYQWPNFNIADSCITIGAGIVAAYFLFAKPPQNDTSKAK